MQTARINSRNYADRPSTRLELNDVVTQLINAWRPIKGTLANSVANVANAASDQGLHLLNITFFFSKNEINFTILT